MNDIWIIIDVMLFKSTLFIVRPTDNKIFIGNNEHVTYDIYFAKNVEHKTSLYYEHCDYLF